jgi:cold shock CspA family protein
MFVRGTVKAIVLDRGFVILEVPGIERDVFAHSYDLADEVDFDESLKHRTLECEIENRLQGPRAVNLREPR